MSGHMVIIGAGMAGHRGVIGLRAGGFQGNITLVGHEQLMPYDRPPLSKSAITAMNPPEPAWLLDSGMAASLKADVRLGTPAIRIDRNARQVVLADASVLSYDKLLLATGASPRRLPVPGGEHAHVLRRFDEALALREGFSPGRRIVIIGGGFIGLELAASARLRGCDVVVIETRPRILMRGVPQEIAQIIHDRHRAAGVEILTDCSITRLDADGVVLGDGRLIAANMVIAGIGAYPETALAEAAGLMIENGIAVDDMLCTSDPDIYAAGDCCSFPHALYGGQRLRLESWRNAQDQGMLAAENMLGAGKAYRAVPWFWSDQYELTLQVAGLPDPAFTCIARQPAEGSLLLFQLGPDGRLMAASGIGPGNAIARDVKLADMLIAKSARPAGEALADPAVPLKSLLR